MIQYIVRCIDSEVMWQFLSHNFLIVAVRRFYPVSGERCGKPQKGSEYGIKHDNQRTAGFGETL